MIARHGEVVSHAQIQKRGRHQPVRGCRNPDPAADQAPRRSTARAKTQPVRRAAGPSRPVSPRGHPRPPRRDATPPAPSPPSATARAARAARERGDQRAVNGVEREPRRESGRRAKEHGEFLSRRRHLQFRLERVFSSPREKSTPAPAPTPSPPGVLGERASRDDGVDDGAASAPPSARRSRRYSGAIDVRRAQRKRRHHRPFVVRAKVRHPDGYQFVDHRRRRVYVALGGGAGWGSVAAAAAATAATRRHPKSS